MHTPPEPELHRRLSWLDATAVALAAMIGAGVFIATGEAAAVTGGSLPLAIVLGGVVATFNGLSAAELGVTYPRAGGAYEFGYRLISPTVGFLAGGLFLLSGFTAGATFALTFASYLQPLVPGLPVRLVGIALTAAAVLVNLIGVRPSARLTRLLVFATIAILIAYVGLAASAFDARRLAPLFAGGITGLLQAAALMFFAFAGYARPVTISEEVKDPARNLPRAVISALSLAGALYLAVALASVGAIGAQELGASSAPLGAVMAMVGPPVGLFLISLGAMLATTNIILTDVWGLSRLVFAMARRKDLPLALGRLTPSGVPRGAILAVGGAIAVLTAFFDLRGLLQASSLAILVYYAIMNLSALRLPRSRLLYPRVISGAGLGGSVVLALSLPASALVVVGVFGVVAVGYWVVVRGWWGDR